MQSSWRSLGSAPPDFRRAVPACAPQFCARPAWRFTANCRAPTRSAPTHVGAEWIRPVRAVTRVMPAVCVTVSAGDPRPACVCRLAVSVLARFRLGTCPYRLLPSWLGPGTYIFIIVICESPLKHIRCCLCSASYI